MNEAQKAFIRSINADPLFAEICRDVKTHQKNLKWKKGRSKSEWAYDTGFGDGIDLVLNTLGYDNGR